MKYAALIITLFTFVLAACNEKPAEKVAAIAPATPEKTAPPIAPGTAFPAGHPNIGPAAPTDSGATKVEETQQATVVSSIDVPQFTYIEVKDGDQTRWLAATTISVKEGDLIEFVEDSTMQDFTSKTLNRTFPSLTFIRNAKVVEKK